MGSSMTVLREWIRQLLGTRAPQPLTRWCQESG